MPTSGLGNSPRRSVRDRGRSRRRGGACGFTLLELLVVIAIIAIGVGLAAISLRDASDARIEEEAARLVALFEGARGVARAADVPVRWEPVIENGQASFRFVGLPAGTKMPDRWLHDETAAEVLGATSVKLGPEPVIGEQHVLIRRGDRRIEIATDGLGAFDRVLPNTGDGAAP
jgi:general secretion pathway protein H